MKYVIVLIVFPAVVFILLSGIIIVSIAWTHRPDLSVADILWEAVFEIKNRICRK